MNKKIKIGINGFGRIGRIATRIIQGRKNMKVVAINSRSNPESHAFLLKHDSTYGDFQAEVDHSKKGISINGDPISVYNFDDPKDIPWNLAGVDLVIESTGKFRTAADLKKHLKKGVKKVLLSAPAKDDTKTLVYGVNHTLHDPKKDIIISNSSCTTNCLSTVLKVLHSQFSVEKGFMTTIHAVTDSQNLLDNSHKKSARLRRAAYLSMIPSTTGSAKDIGKLFPDLNGHIACQAIRIPTPTVSMIDLTVAVKKGTNAESVNKAFEKASKTYLSQILAVSLQELVSSDYKKSPYSSIVDTYMTDVIDNKLVKVYAWYDNEWGYTTRLVDMSDFLMKGI